jgi:hypothetical protein
MKSREISWDLLILCVKSRSYNFFDHLDLNMFKRSIMWSRPIWI